MTLSIDSLRQKLDEILQTDCPSELPTLIGKLQKSHHHSIQMTANCAIGGSVDCFQYAFKDQLSSDHFADLVRTREVRKMQRVLVAALSLGLIELHDNRLEVDKIVVYFHGRCPKHFGILDGGRILSKWGMFQAYCHGLFELPTYYGDKVKYSSGALNVSVLEGAIRAYS